MVVVGLISDTHGVLDEHAVDALRGVSSGLILHAGDVGDSKKKSRAKADEILATLSTRTGCRVVAVAGNVDEGLADLPTHTTLTVSEKKILLLHICNYPPKTTAAAKKLIDTESPDIVVFGHSHVPGMLWHGNTLYINPGSAGPKRFKLPRCLALLSIGAAGQLQVTFKAIGSDPEDAKKLPGDMEVAQDGISMASRLSRLKNCPSHECYSRWVNSTLRSGGEWLMWSDLVDGKAQDARTTELEQGLARLGHLAVGTYASLLRQCTELEPLQRIHARILKDGVLRWDRFLLNVLVEMYGKCGSLDEAHKLFDSIRQKNVYSWTILLSAYSEDGRFRDVLKLFNEMDLEGVKANEVTYATVVGAIAEVEDLSLGWKVHDRIALSFHAHDVVLGTALINMYAKCDSLEDAKEVFDKLPRRDLVCWNAMISAYTQQGHPEEAISMFNQIASSGMKANLVTYAVLFKAVAARGLLEEARTAHKCLVLSRTRPDLVANTALLHMYVKCGSFEDAKYLFDRMQWKNVVSWNVMIAAYSEEGLYDQALELYDNMESEGVKADSTTFANVLEACTFQERLPDGKAIHQSVISSGLSKNIVVASALISMYARCRSLEDACLVFEDVSATGNVVPWTAMLTAYAQRGSGKQGIYLFQKMDLEGVKPNRVTYVAAIEACSSVGALLEGHSIFARLAAFGYELDVILGTALISFYGKCSSLQYAFHIFNAMSWRNIVTWNALVAASTQHGLGHLTIYLVREMQLDGIKPNEMTFLNIFIGCNHCGLWKEAVMYFLSMVLDHEMVAASEHYGCLIDLLGRSGRLEEAETFITGQLEVDWVHWMTLLGSCTIHLDVERGVRAARQILRLQPQRAAAYVMLSNMFLTTGRLHDLNCLKLLAKERKIGKTEPGRSYIEINGVVHEFGGGIGPHVMSEQIGAQLHEWSKQMVKENFVPLHDIRGYHDEKLAVALGVLSTPKGSPLLVVKNMRICTSCHSAIKFIAKVTGRHIAVRDSNRIHHFSRGSCSCEDYW